MLPISEVLSVPTLQWNQVVWYEILILIVAVIGIQKGLNVYTENKLSYFLPKTTNIISYILSLVFVLLSYVYVGDITLSFIVVALAMMILNSTSLIDVHYQELPNEYNIALTVLSLIYLGLNFNNYESILMGGIIAFVLFFLIMVLSGSVGGGDVKMSFAIGAFISASGLLSWVMMTFFSGALIAIILVVSKKLGRKDFFAFGPFMAYSSIYLMMFFI